MQIAKRAKKKIHYLENLCENDESYDDSNPCTTEYCVAETGNCNYENQSNGTQCSLTATCQEGICTEPEPETGDEGNEPTGFFGLGNNALNGIGGFLAALILGILLVSWKKGKK